MNNARPQFQKLLFLIFIFVLVLISNVEVLSTNFPVHNESSQFKKIFTKEERDYILKNPRIKAGSMDGVAPIQYMGEDGEIKGISKGILDEISDITSIEFEYKLYQSVEETINSDVDMIFGAPYQYIPDSMTLSQPFLKSSTILYINSSLNPSNLNDKTYAAISGRDLPKGIEKENSIYFNTREESLDAVNSGKADYGYGNAYSVAFYTLQNNYKNILTIPQNKESREYAIAIPKDNKILLSIMNKAIEEIDEATKQTLILDIASHIDRKLTFSMVIESYGPEIFAIAIIIIILLSTSIFFNIRARNRWKLENKKYRVLSEVANEYFYEYNVNTNKLSLSKNCANLFGTKEISDEVKTILKNHLSTNTQSHIFTNDNIINIKLPLLNGKEGIFKSYNSSIYDDKKNAYSIIGKLINISEETEKRQKLIRRSRTDGLTGLYNATTTKDLIIQRISNRNKSDSLDAFILIDCDDFKDINDTYGHLAGNQALKNISYILKLFFRKTDIIGRIGGDEFCVYMKDISSTDFVFNQCYDLIKSIEQINKDYNTSASIGITFIEAISEYKKVFIKADKALYKAKKKGKGEVVIYDEIVSEKGL